MTSKLVKRTEMYAHFWSGEQNNDLQKHTADEHR